MSITKKVDLYHEPSYAGQVLFGQAHNVVSMLNKTAETILAGTAVQADGADAVKPLAEGGKPLGIVVREVVHEGSLGIPTKRTGSVLTTGVIWVEVGETVAKGDAVFAGVGANVKGKFTKAAGSAATAAIAVPNAQFLDAATAGKLARVSIVIGG